MEIEKTTTRCFAACVACLLEVPLSSVPECFTGLPAGKWDSSKQQEWLAQYGLFLIDIECQGREKFLGCVPGAIGIQCGHAKRDPEVLHAVVVEGTETGFVCEQDPHPDESFLIDCTHLAFLGTLVPTHHKLDESERGE